MGVWYIDEDRVAVNWASAVVGGQATVDIFELLVEDDRYERTLVWARAGTAVSQTRVDNAVARTTAGAVPAPILPPANPPTGGGGSGGVSDGSFRGTWSAGTDYRAGDTVAHAGSTWGAATDPAVGAVPGVSAAWVELAAADTAHAASHTDGGVDEIAVHASQITGGTVGTARLGSGSASAATFLRGDQTWAAPPAGGGWPPALSAALTVGVGTLLAYNDTGGDVTVTGVRVALSEAAVGTVTVQPRVNGVASGAAVSVSNGQTTSGLATRSITIPSGGTLTVEVTAAGTPSSVATFTVFWKV